MGRVHRRTVITALAATAALSACTAERAPRSAPSAPGPLPPSEKSLPPSGNSVPPSGKGPSGSAPAESLPIRTQKFSLARGKARPLPTTVWRPASGGPYPLVLFSHGLRATPQSYAEMLGSWARAGFVVAAPAYPHTAGTAADYNPLDVLNQPADASYVIGEVVKRGGVDEQRIAAGGHSAGGITTLGMFTTRDERLRAGVILAGRQIIKTPLTGPAVPLLFVHGKRDRTVAYADGHAVYDAVTWPKAFLTFPGGGHVATGAELDVVIATSTDFWRWSLYGDPAAKARLAKDATRGGHATLADRL
jgi:prepilin-type processing-associated H-X9-DG protein